MAIAYEVWCTVGRHEPSLLALLAYQDSPHISANEMLRQKLKTVLLTALLTGAFPLSSHPPAPRRHKTFESIGIASSRRQPAPDGLAVAHGYKAWYRRVWSGAADPCADPDRPLCRTQKRFRHDSRLAARSRLSDSFPLDAYTHAPHGATKAARPLR